MNHGPTPTPTLLVRLLLALPLSLPAILPLVLALALALALALHPDRQVSAAENMAKVEELNAKVDELKAKAEGTEGRLKEAMDRNTTLTLTSAVPPVPAVPPAAPPVPAVPPPRGPCLPASGGPASHVLCASLTPFSCRPRSASSSWSINPNAPALPFIRILIGGVGG